MRKTQTAMRVELVTGCEHGYEEAHYLCAEDQSEHDPLNFSCECPGGSRTILDEAKPLWWCEVHQAPDGDRIIDAASRCPLSLEEGLWAYDCRMVDGVWFPLPDKETTDLGEIAPT